MGTRRDSSEIVHTLETRIERQTESGKDRMNGSFIAPEEGQIGFRVQLKFQGYKSLSS